MRKLVFILILFAWTGMHPASGQEVKTKHIQFEQIFDETFQPERVSNVNWMKDGRYYTALVRTDTDLEIRKYDLLTGSHEPILFASELTVTGRKQPIMIQDYQFSSDETNVLIEADLEQIWRRSTMANYFVHDLESGKTVRLTQSKKKQQYAQLSPEGDKAAFVVENDLYWVDLATGNETRITNDGEPDKVINGAADWVYEEEFGLARAWFWSPDGSKISFYRFDESHVKEFFMTEWGSLYPGLTRFKYPKAGERNSIVKIGVYDLESGVTTWMDIGSEQDQYIPRINWTRDSGTLAIRRMNRLQNRQELLLADSETGKTQVIKTETSKGWIDVNDDLTFLEDGKRFIYLSEESGYNHIYLYSLGGKLIRQVTKGEWEVTDFLGHNDKNGTVYFISSEDSPLERHLYSINIDSTGKRKMSDGDGWHSVNMSRDFRYYIETWSGPAMPDRITLHEADGKKVRTLEDNASLSRRQEVYNTPTKEFFSIDLPQARLNAYMLKPHDFDPSRKYPMLVFVYGGPGSQQVTKEFGTRQRQIWHRYLTTRGYLVMCVDNRGTGARGRAFEQQVYKKLGQYEVTDQIDAVRQVIGNRDYIDTARIGIWGWSYGGYMSTLLMEEGNDLFKAGIAVAPVTSWGFYDTIYTERYMQTPAMNPDGYEQGSALENAGHISGHFLLVHGTGDDNVHFQNSVALIDRMVEEEVQFETIYYPNRAHSLEGGNTRRHLFRKMTDFILEKL